ncbi:MAG: hypothetical protein JW888_10160 [Pirellulales bacterium]|nr:hypothetical protein [Pirellulales bacterium]
MYSRWASFAVIVLWLTTMTWLVKEKVLPALLIGEPPDGQKVLAARESVPLVGWHLRWNGEPVGWALSLTERSSNQVTEIRSRVRFERLPLGDITPGWLPALFDSVDAIPSRIRADANTRLLLDSDGQLMNIRSSVRFEPFGEEISMVGEVRGVVMKLVVRSRGLCYRTEMPIDPTAIHGEALSPQTQLPGLHEGQTWTVEVGSPLSYPTCPVEVLQASVVGLNRLCWQGEMLPVWLVEYHTNPGHRLSTASETRGRLWVRPDGTVLVQEVSILNAKMRFVRMEQEEAEALADQYELTVTQ